MCVRKKGSDSDTDRRESIPRAFLLQRAATFKNAQKEGKEVQRLRISQGFK